ncbi:MAG: DNA mismatch repair endonuclease MutL [Bacteroidetes bacterium]|nr:DNA mismatch repair endonuclease MutL [Bacteroidota bacterium]
MQKIKSIQVLNNSVAQRIAAGEVIDRPESVIRELLDNAIDAKSSAIDVYIQNGGIEEIRVMDDGSGMNPSDLRICCSSHATSKISKVEDLYKLSTLGFRGEALYSISACTKLTIISKQNDNIPYTLSIQEGVQEGPDPGGSTKGTTIIAKDIFYSIPGRRKFLKRPQAEGTACRKTFLNKALPFPEIAFRFFTNGKLRHNLPVSDQLQRILQAYQETIHENFMGTTEMTAGDFSIKAVCSTPDVFRTDRSYIQIYINKRRIHEFSLLQAVTYGYNDYLPGGSFPYCFLFITINPELVDFNIHPAKREAKIRNITEIHHETVQMIKSWLFKATAKQIHTTKITSNAAPTLNFTDFSSPAPRSSHGHGRKKFPQTQKNTKKAYEEAVTSWLQEAAEKKSDLVKNPVKNQADDKLNFIYRGQVFNLFLIAETGNSILLIDQHAAHERIIYEELINNSTSQKLLIPYIFEPEKEIETFLLAHTEIYSSIGIEIKQKSIGLWELLSLPAVCKTIQNDILDFIMNSAGNSQEIEKKLYAMISCRAAVKDGDVLDPVTASNLIQKALKLKIQRCPHGRPLWKEITRDQLFRDVERIL